MGVIPSFSVLPIITCTNCSECKNYCYACKGCFNFNNNIMNLAENTALVENEPKRVVYGINAFLNNPTTIYRYFRWNVAGDVFSMNYLQIIIDVAKNNPVTTFLVFTKNYDLFTRFEKSIPENVTVVFSKWSNTEIKNPCNYPVAIVNIENETILPNGSFHCSGDCANCLDCWKAKKGTTRHFDLH